MLLVSTGAEGLPGEHELDGRLIDAFVARVQEVHRRKSLEMALEIGRAALDTFFQGDVDLFRSRSRKHVSFRALAQREDLPLSASTLNRMLGVVVQVKSMDPGLARELPFSHHRLLLPVRSVERKNELARTAVSRGLGKRDFAAMVRATVEDQGKMSNGGRRPLPPLLRIARNVEAALREAPPLGSAPMWPGAANSELLRLADGLEQHGRSLVRLAERVRSQVRR